MKTCRLFHGVRCLAVAAVAACAGCMPPPSQVKLDELNRTVASLRAQNVEQRRQIEELENQVFVLGDKVESREVTAARAAPVNLPKITLSPGKSAAPSDDNQSASFPYGDDSDVEYVGEAAKSSKSRPLLRLVGSGNDVSTQVQVAGPAAPTRVTAIGQGDARRVSVRNSDGTPLLLYKQSLDHLKATRHADAAAGFREFLRRYPHHDYSDNAQYWLAECYYDLKDFVTAVREFRRVVDDFPQGNKVPDALLKTGLGYLLLGNDAAGRSTLAELQKSYATHTAAGVAAARIRELDGAPEDAALVGAQNP